MALPIERGAREFNKFVEDGSGNVAVRTVLTSGDIEIGAVELKDGSTDARANILAANTARTTATVVVATQPIDAAGNVLGRTAANTARTTGTLVDPIQVVDAAGNVINVTAANTARTTATLTLPIQPIDAAGNVPKFTGAVTPTATLTGREDTLPWAVYNATPTVRTEAQGGPLQADTTGSLLNRETYAPGYEDNTNGIAASAMKPLSVSTYAWTLFTNFSANATLNVKASTGNVRSVYCHSTNAATRYLQLHNTATVPAGAAVPLYTFLIPASGVVVIDSSFFGDNGANFTTGIAFAFSTTEATYTAGTAGEQLTQIMYK